MKNNNIDWSVIAFFAMMTIVIVAALLTGNLSNGCTNGS